MGRRGGDVETGGEAVWHREAVEMASAEQVVPYPHVADKKGRDAFGLNNPSPKPDHIPQRSSTRKIKPHYLWL